jgi:hypothetical protein
LLFRIDVSDMGVEDLLIGDEQVEVEALVWDHLGFEIIRTGMMIIYEKIIEKRRINRAEVSRILDRAKGEVRKYQHADDFYCREIMDHLEGVEQATESDRATQSDRATEFDTVVGGSGRMSFPPKDVSDMILDAVLRKYDPSVEHVAILNNLMTEWRGQASSYDKLRISYWMIKFGAKQRLGRNYFFKGLASEFNIIIRESRFLRYLGTSDPRLVFYAMCLQEADFSDEKTSEFLNRFRRLSLAHKSLAVFFDFYCASGRELRDAILLEFEGFESSLATVSALDAALNPPIPALIRELSQTDFELLRNPVEATFSFLNALAPADFEDLSWNFRSTLTGLLDLLNRLRMVLRIVPMEKRLSAIVVEIKQKLRRILNERIHIPGSIDMELNSEFPRMLWKLFSPGQIDKRPAVEQADRWNKLLDHILDGDGTGR